MRIIKERTEKHCVLRTESYSHTLAHIEMLFEEAKKDFPSLKPEDVELVYYGGERYARTNGIEFIVPNGAPVPEEYQPIAHLEYTK